MLDAGAGAEAEAGSGPRAETGAEDGAGSGPGVTENVCSFGVCVLDAGKNLFLPMRQRVKM